MKKEVLGVSTRRSTRLQKKKSEKVKDANAFAEETQQQSSTKSKEFNVSKNESNVPEEATNIEDTCDRTKNKLTDGHAVVENDQLETKTPTQRSDKDLFSVIRQRKSLWKEQNKKEGNNVDKGNNLKIDTEFVSLEKNETTKIKTDSKKPVSKFKLDLHKYKKFNNTNLPRNALLKTADELKSHFPFKNHLKDQGLQEINDSPSIDNFGLDGTIMTDSEKTDTRNALKIHTDITKVGTYFEVTDNDVKSVHSKEVMVNKLMEKSVLPKDLERLEKCPKFYENRFIKDREKKKQRQETAGPNWYNLPKTEITDEVKRDLQIIKMRNVLDGKHHYKRNDTNKFPTYFQMGTILEGSHEYYSARISKKERKRTMVDELLADAEFRRKNKRKLIDINKKKSSGGKEYYKQKNNKRKPTWART